MMLFEVDDSVMKEIEIRKDILCFLEDEYGCKSEYPPTYPVDLFGMYDRRWSDELVALILQLEGLQEANADETVEYRISQLEELEERFHEKMQEIRLRRQAQT